MESARDDLTWRRKIKKIMKQIIFVLLLVAAITQAPLLVGARDFHETIIDFFQAVLIYIPLGRWLGKKITKRQSKD